MTHTVRPGESLWSIADAHLGEGARYPEILDLNPRLRAHPNLIVPGQKLALPAAPPAAGDSGHTYTVRAGDTLSEIAHRELGDARLYPRIVTASAHMVQPGGRHLTDPDLILPGWQLTIPAREPSPSTAPHPRPAPAPHPKSTGPTTPTAPTTSPGETSEPPGATQTEGPPQPAADLPGADRSVPLAGLNGGGAITTNATDEQPATPAWLLAGLAGGGTILAGSMMMLLRRRRSSQFRARRPGRTIATPDPALAPVEKTVMGIGSGSGPTIEAADQLLRRLAAHHGRDGQVMPAVAAVELTGSAVVLHLGTPAALPPPWIGSEDAVRWWLPESADQEKLGPIPADQPAPYPLLVTVGTGDDGHVWLLNLEDLDVAITGDPTYGADFARYIAAEVACNPWSAGVRVDCVGVADEVGPMNRDRVHVHDHSPDVVGDVLADAVSTVDRARAAAMNVSAARAAQAGADSWPARMLVIDAAADPGDTLSQLLDLLHEQVGHTGTAVVVNGDRDGTPGATLHLSSDGRVCMPQVGLDLVAVGLTSDEAQGCAALLAQAEDLDDVPIPVDERADDGWRTWTNEAGALRDSHTLPRGTDPGELDEPAGSILDDDDQHYLEVAATTAEDLATLAPLVTDTVRHQVEDADPTLDQDVAAWFSERCPLPRLTLLGPVHARTHGTAVTKRKPYWTEILAYLATRPHGATPEELADAFNITPTKAREYVRTVRDWLGTNPLTGQRHLPDAREAPAATTNGVAVYQVVDVLVDADLFRRLRARGEARGADGINDLRAALRLVTGRPFDKLRAGGWTWLYEGDRLDQHMTCAIVDVAHLVTTHALHAGDLKTARLAAETAALAAPDEETPRLDLVAVARAEGHQSEADRILRDDVCNRTDDDGAPPEPPQRTDRVLQARGWLDRGQAAS